MPYPLPLPRAALLGVLVPALAGAVSAAPGIYVEQDRHLVIEVESAPPQAWKVETGLPGYAGTGYLAWRGAYNPRAGSTSVLAWRLRIVNPGRYAIRFRIYYTETEGAEHNDWYGRLQRADGSAVDAGAGDAQWHKITAGPVRGAWAIGGNWGPSNSPNVLFDLSAGDYVLAIAPRSTDRAVPGQNVHLDRIVIFQKDAAKRASDAATPASVPIPAPGEAKP